MGYEVQKKFDRNEVGLDVMGKLDRHADAIHGIQANAVYKIGKELKEAHDELANHRSGVFYAWCESIGMSIKNAQRALNYYDFIRTNCPNNESLIDLPKSLIYEAAKKSAPAELKRGVINGDITTLKEYRELKAQLDAEKEARKHAEEKAEASAQDTEQMYQQMRAKFTEAQEQKARASEAEAEAQSLKLELMHKQSVIDALKHKQKMAAPPQVVYQDSEDTVREMSRLKAELEHVKEKAKDNDILRAENDRLQRENAQYLAHEEGQTLREKAMIDAEFAKYKDNSDKELQNTMMLSELFKAIIYLPHNLEMRNVINDYIKHGLGSEETNLADVKKNLVDLKAVVEAMDEALNERGKLRIVK